AGSRGVDRARPRPVAARRSAHLVAGSARRRAVDAAHPAAPHRGGAQSRSGRPGRGPALRGARLEPARRRPAAPARWSPVGLDAAQSSADNEISTLDLTPKLALPTSGELGALSGLPGIVTGLLGQPAGLPTGLISSLTTLSPLLGPDGLVGALLGGGIGLNSLVRATDVASTATVQPAGAGAEQALASTRVGDLQVLPQGASLLRG